MVIDELFKTNKAIFKWFPKSQGLANSAILSANGFSILIFNQVQTFYINPQNLPPDKPYSPEFKDEKLNYSISQFFQFLTFNLIDISLVRMTVC